MRLLYYCKASPPPSTFFSLNTKYSTRKYVYVTDIMDIRFIAQRLLDKEKKKWIIMEKYVLLFSSKAMGFVTRYRCM